MSRGFEATTTCEYRILFFNLTRHACTDWRLIDTLFETETLLLVLVDTLPEVPTEKISNINQTNQIKNLIICTNNFVLWRFKHYLKTMAGLD